MSSLSIGTLTGFLRMDEDNFRRGLANGQLRMRSFQRDLNSRLRDLHHNFRQWARGLGQDLDESEGGSNRLAAGLRRIGGMVGSLSGVAGSIARIAAMLGAAVPLAGGLVATLANIAPAAGLAVTGLVAIQLATNAVKLGMQGVGDAVKLALDPEKAEEFDKALKKLAPNARAFAKEIKSLQPEFKKIQQDVQQRLFKGLTQVMREMAKDVLPVLSSGLKDAADSLNSMAVGVGRSASSLARNGVLGTAIAGANAGLRNLSRIPGQIVTGLTQVAAAAAPSFGILTDWAGKTADSLSQKFTKAFQSGAMQRAIEQAIVVIGDLVEVAGNVASIVGSIFSAAQVSGGGFLGTLKKITGALADAFASPKVQAGLKAIFKVMAAVADAVAPILISALTTIAGVFAKLGPPVQLLVKHLGAGLLKVVDALGPVLISAADAVGKLVIAALPFVDLAADLIAGLLPSLTPLFEFLGEVFERMAPIVKELADNLAAQLTPILAVLPGILEKILPQLLEIVDRLLPLFVDVLAQLGPGLGELAVSLAELLVELTPLLVKFLQFQVFLLDKMLPVITPLVTGFGALLVGALRTFSQFITDFVIPAVRTLVALLNGDFGAATRNATTFVNNMRDNASRAFNNLKENGSRAAASLAAAVVRRAREMGSQFVGTIRRLVNDAVARMAELPGRILRAFGNADGLLSGVGRALIRGLINGVTSMIPSLSGTFSGITSMIPDWKGPAEVDAKLLTGNGQLVMQGFMRGIQSQVPALRSQLGGLTSAMPGMAMAGMPAGAGGGGQRVVLEVRAGDSSGRTAFLVEEIREHVEVKGGGDVQRAFGSRQ